MSDVRVRGTTDPAEIAVVLAILRHDGAAASVPGGISAWQRVRRAALAGNVGQPRTPTRRMDA